MSYILGKRSRANLEGVHPKLVRVVELAIKTTTQDFTVLDGLRTVAEQREYVRRGVSRTMNSKHLPQEDGYGHAVDLVPWINGKPRWEWEAIYPIAMAMSAAAFSLGEPIRWGGAWDMISPKETCLFKCVDDARHAVSVYVEYRRNQGKSAFIDGPHYEYRPDLA